MAGELTLAMALGALTAQSVFGSEEAIPAEKARLRVILAPRDVWLVRILIEDPHPRSRRPLPKDGNSFDSSRRELEMPWNQKKRHVELVQPLGSATATTSSAIAATRVRPRSGL